MNQINVVPYIDVMLVLLVIFMVTAPLMNPGMIDLPSDRQDFAPPAAPIEISISAGGGCPDGSGHVRAPSVRSAGTNWSS